MSACGVLGSSKNLLGVILSLFAPLSYHSDMVLDCIKEESVKCEEVIVPPICQKRGVQGKSKLEAQRNMC